MPSIIQRIALEGGAAIKAQLEAIGAAGKKAFSDLQGAVASNRTFGNVGAAIESVKVKAAELGAGAGRLGRDLNNLGNSVTSVAGIFGIGLIGSLTGAAAALFGLVRGAASSAAALQRAADAAGVSTDKFQELTFAAGKVNLDQDDITKLLTRINKVAGESIKSDLELQKAKTNLRREFTAGKISAEDYLASGIKLRRDADEQVNVFNRLGISVHDGNGNIKDAGELLNDFADALQTVPAGANRAALALEITGSRNSKFNSLINKGSEGIAAFAKEMDRVAPKATTVQIAVDNKLNAAFSGLKSTLGSLRDAVGSIFAPSETRLIVAFQELIVAARTSVILFAADIATKVTPIVDDLIAVMQGRDKDVKNNIILVLRDGIASFAQEAQKAINDIILPALGALLKALDFVAEAINGIFGTKLSGKEIGIALVIAKVIGIFGIFAGIVKIVVGGIGLLVTAFGPLGVIVAAIGFAIGFVLVKALKDVDWAGLAKRAQAAWDDIKNAVASVGKFITDAFDTSINFIKEAWNGIVGFFSGIGEAIGGFFNRAAIAISDAFNTSVQFVQGLWNGLLEFFASLPATLGSFFVSIGNGIKNAFLDAVNAVKSFIDDLWAKVTSVFSNIVAAAQRVASAVKSAVGANNTLADQAGLNSFAGGGAVRGPGTARSDSILAWLSNGEYVIPQKAVAHFGKPFFEAIRQLRNPFAGFNAGGFVDALSAVGPGGFPRFATGGLALAGSGLRPVNINFEGQTFSAQMTEDMLGRLTQASVARRVKSAGKRPGFVGV